MLVLLMIQALKKNGYVLLIYAILVFSGGLMGFIMKKSIPSLVAGGAFGLTLLWSSVLHFTCRKWGIYFAFILLFLLEGFFSYRFVISEKFFPAGVMLILTSGVIILLVTTLVKGSREEHAS